jgi:hypothetical protein
MDYGSHGLGRDSETHSSGANCSETRGSFKESE